MSFFTVRLRDTQHNGPLILTRISGNTVQQKLKSEDRMKVPLRLWLGHSKHGHEPTLIQKGLEDQIVYHIRQKCKEFLVNIFHAVTVFW